MRIAHFPTRAGRCLWVAAALLCACPSGPQHPVAVTFRISVPLSTPTTASVSIVGDAPALGDGNAPGLPLEKLAEGQFSGKAMLESGSSVHFQILQVRPAATELRDDFSTPDRTFTVGPEGTPQTVAVTVARWVPELPATHAPVLFEITPGPTTPGGATLFLAGSAPELGSWRPDGVPLVLRSDGRYVTRVGLEKASTVQFKVTRGSWATVERGPSVEDIPNHTYTVPDAGGTAAVATATWKDLEPTAVLTGDIRYERGVASAILGNSRDAIVYLPPDYESGTARYPVLYFNDGQNLMDPRTSFAGVEWGVDEAAQRLIRNGQMTPIIVVGVYNTPNRIAEYTQLPNPPHGGGAADDYGRFLLEELKPLIDSRYRTLTTASSTGIAGSSLGGLVSLYLGLTRTDAFGRVGAVSPSIWWANKDITTRYQALATKPPLRIWEDMGTDEGSTPQEEIADARALRDVLLSKGWALGADLQYLEIQNGIHSESAWAARIDQILAYLYPPP